MIVSRIEYRIRIAHLSDAIELMKWSREQLGPLAADRLCFNTLGEGGNRIAAEREFESLAEYEKWHEEYSAAIGKLWDEMKAKGFLDAFEGANYKEIWKLF